MDEDITDNAVAELVNDLRRECRSNDPFIAAQARARCVAVANEVAGYEYSEPELSWYYAGVVINWEWATRIQETERMALLAELELAIERFDEWWERLCDEPADDTEPQPTEEIMAVAAKAKKSAEETVASVWRCLHCGSETSTEVDRCHACKVERGTRPAKKSRKSAGVPETQAEASAKEAAAANGHVRAVGLENGRVAWQCRTCGRMNPDTSNVCSCASGTESPPAETNGAKRGTKAPELETLAGRTDHDVPLSKIQRRTDNPRQVFDLAKLEQLAESIKGVGLISRIVVRAAASGWELWAGERRVRACELLGWKAIPARVFPAETPDATMEAIRAWENLQREDLDPIEESRSLQQLLSSGAYGSQKALGEALGLSQGEVSLRLRMTELPAEWQQRVIAHEISTSHAKHLYAWLDVPAVLQEAADGLGDRNVDGASTSEREFREIIADAARSASKPLSPNDCPFKVTKELRGQLDVRPVPNVWGGKPQDRAFNVELWNQQAKEAKKKARENNAAEATSQKPSRPDPWDQVPRTWEVAERVTGWAARQILSRLQRSDRKLVQRIFLMMGCCRGLAFPDAFLKQIKVSTRGHVPTEKIWPKLAAADDALLAGLPFDAIVETLNDRHLDRKLVVAIAATLGANPEADWRPEEADLNLYDEKGLAKLVKQHGYDVGEAKGKKAVVAALVKAWKLGDLPKAFRTAFGER